jgi:glycogen synthase
MKIAFVSYEFPPDTALGGIATYVYQAARMLADRGHQVEVFTSSPSRSGTQVDNGTMVHRINEGDQEKFRDSVGLAFSARHAVVRFDVLEGPEYSADALECVRLVPDIPLVVKLHTPSFLVRRFSRSGLGRLGMARVLLHGLLRGYWERGAINDDTVEIDGLERIHVLQADEIVAPSRAIAEILSHEWLLDRTKISVVPYPYIPPERFLRIPAETHTSLVTFLGRLEMRKGVTHLAQAIPLIIPRHPNVRFQFVGNPENSPEPDLNMRQFLERQLRSFRHSVEICGGTPFDTVSEVLARSDICVYPSIWENFPYVCLEAMAAARGIVGSYSGGMLEMLDGGRVGRLVPPFSPNKIAAAVIDLLQNPELRMSLGREARERVLSEYSAGCIGPLQEATYLNAISRRRVRGVRRDVNATM